MSMVKIPQSNVTESAWTASRLHRILLAILEGLMVGELFGLVRSESWMLAFVTVLLMAVIAAPVLFRGRLGVAIPSELHIFAALFIFATLFLGEVLDFYNSVWWWDLALHGCAGLLLGLLGFLFVYLVNENELVDVNMRPSFVALFAFFFSVGLGTLWEIFEFAMDQTFGLEMQKSQWGDSTGLSDTMWDLIVDMLGAAIMAGVGWLYMRRAHRERTDHWLRRFVERYPRFFKP
jgi:hypothetical protein